MQVLLLTDKQWPLPNPPENELNSPRIHIIFILYGIQMIKIGKRRNTQ